MPFAPTTRASIHSFVVETMDDDASAPSLQPAGDGEGPLTNTTTVTPIASVAPEPPAIAWPPSSPAPRPEEDESEATGAEAMEYGYEDDESIATVVDVADTSAENVLATAEDLFHCQRVTNLRRPVVFRLRGEHKVPYELMDAVDLLDSKGVGAFTRQPLRLNDICPIRLTDSRLPDGHRVLQHYDETYVATVSGLLCEFVARNDMYSAMRLVEKEAADVNAREGIDGNTPLHLAVIKGLLPVAEWLMDTCAADLFSTNYQGATPFLTAVAENSPVMVRALVQRVAGNPAARTRMLHGTDKEGASAYVIAIRNDFVSMMMILHEELQAPIDAFDVSLGEKTNSDDEDDDADAEDEEDDHGTETEDEEEPTSSSSATGSKRKRNQQDASAKRKRTAAMTRRRGIMSLSPVMTAIEVNKPPSSLRILSLAGANLETARKGSMNALELAASHGKIGHVLMLLRLGLSPTARAFRVAARHNQVRVLRALANSAFVPPEMDMQDDALADLPLFPWPYPSLPPKLAPARALTTAVTSDAFQAVEELCFAGARRGPALVEAIRLNKMWAVRSLTADGRLDWPRTWDETPLTVAIQLNRWKMLHMIVDKVPLDIVNRPRPVDGLTALDMAMIIENRQQSVAALLSSSTSAADPKPPGPTASMCAEILRAKGAVCAHETNRKRRRLAVE